MFILLVNFLIFVQSDLPQVLTNYPDDSKAILIFAYNNQTDLYKKSLSMLIRDPLGLDNRDIKIFEIFNEGGIGPGGEAYSLEEVTSIRNYYNIARTDFKILLTNKKFEEILRSNEPLKVDVIFERFDRED